MAYIKIGIIWFYIFLVIATIFAPEGYLSYYHTMSELAAQRHDLSWIMLIGFYGNALFYFIGATVLLKKHQISRFLIILLYLSSFSMLFIAYFQTTFDGYPETLGKSITLFNQNIYWIDIHINAAYFNQLIGYMMITYHIVVSDSKMKLLHITFTVFSVLFALLFLTIENRGIFQRLLSINNSIWIFFFFSKYKVKEIKKVS
jgi:hypothetical protein